MHANDDRENQTPSPTQNESEQVTFEVEADFSARAVASDLSSSVINNRFALERELGCGGFSVTYLAVDLSNDRRPVVVKVLRGQSDAKTRDWIEGHFRDEVKALSRIDHPGVVKLIDSGAMPDGRPYIAMEYVEGCSLRSLIEPEKGVGDFEQVARIIRQLGEAISAAHDRGVYHRDLKPENVLLAKAEDEEQVKVIDFGISTVKNSFDEKTRATVLAGSVRYMSPEQIEGRPSASSDTYGLGVIAYEMITGRVPFSPDADTPAAAIIQLLEMQRAGVRVKPADLRPRLPQRAQDVLLRALAYDPGQRYKRAEQFGADLAAAIIKPSGEIGEIAPGRPSLPLVPIAGALAVIVAIAAVLWFNGTEPGVNLNANVNVSATEDRKLSYWGELQPYKNNKPSGSRMKLTGGIAGETYFSRGDGLTFHFIASEDGYLYLIHEEKADGSSNYSLLFPSPQANNNSSEVGAGRTVATSENVFDAHAGTENVWIVWSAERIAKLEEAIRLRANERAQGRIKDAVMATTIRRLLDENRGNARAEADMENERMNLRSKSRILVYLLRLKHR